ncbi:hypothetical protein CUN67_04430 [Pantoea cypripedii]|uniref:Uncharacterized protein n=1 Tax=Pantoea cypripedii TaxID=55209 RepID=A0A6B9G2F6_PANCY|nr:hypothetical protein CUN67_04430 [Pantoea cypripedii]
MIYPLHTSNCRCVSGVPSPRSLTSVSSRGFPYLLPSCNPNYFGHGDRRNGLNRPDRRMGCVIQITKVKKDFIKPQIKAAGKRGG